MEQRLIRELELVFVINTQRFQGPMNQIKTALQAITVLMNTLKKSTQDWLLTLNTAVGKAVKVSVGGMQARAPGNVETLGLSAASIANMKARTMELNVITKLINAEKGYEAAVNRTTKAQRDAANAEKMRVRELQSHAKALRGATDAHRGLTRETMGGIRVFGTQGFLGAIALVRNHLLLLAFALGSVGVAMRSVLNETKDTQMALAGVTSIAQGFGHASKGVAEAVQKYADTGLMTVKESANAMKMLLSMEGVSLDMADKAMQAMMDWAAFNRLGQYTVGQAMEVTAQGFKEQRSQVTDAIGWVTNLDNAWKKWAAQNDTTVGKMTNAQKNLASLTILMQESAVVQGNSTKAVTLYGGKLTELSVAIRGFKKELGEGLINVLQGAASEMIKMYKGFAEYLRINKDIIALNVGKEFQSLGRTITGIITGIFNLAKGFAQFYSQHSTFIKSMAIAVISTKALDLAFVSLIPKVRKLARDIRIFANALQFTYIVHGGLNAEFFKFAKQIKGFNVLRLGVIAAAIMAIVYAFMKLHDVQQKRMTAQRDAIVQEMKETRSLHSVAEAQKKHNEKMIEYYDLLASKSGLTAIQKTLYDTLKSSIGGINVELDKLLEKLKLLEFKKSLEDIKLKAKELQDVIGTQLNLAAIQNPAKGQANLNAQMLNLSKSFEAAGFSAKDFADYNNYANLSIEQQNEFLAKVLAQYLRWQAAIDKMPEGSLRTNMQQLVDTFGELYKLLASTAKVQSAIPAPNSDDKIDELNEAYKNWLSTLEKIISELNRMKMGDFTFALWQHSQEVNKMVETLNAAKGGMKSGEYQQGMALIEEYDFLKRQELAQKHADKLSEINAKKYEKEVKQHKEMTEKIKGFDEDYRNERIQINQEITDGLKERFQKEFDAQIEQSRRLYESSVDFMQNTVGSFFNERELLKQNKQSELQDIMSAYQQDLISHEEMVARKLKVEEDYSRKVSNLRNSLNKDIINSAINTAGQYLQTWINTYIAKQQAEYVTSLGKTGMSALAGGLLSVGAGLLVGGTLAFLSYQATKKYKESDTSSYMPISASGQSDSERKRFGGIAGASIQYLNIIPTVSISQNSTVIFGAGSMETVSQDLSDMMLTTMQQAIDGQVLDLTGVSPQ